jgi:hypothetical protein
MASFEASPIPSSFGNVLYSPATMDAAAIQNAGNALLLPSQVQSARQQVGAAEMEQMGRAAAYIRSGGTPEERAARYGVSVQQLQQNGFARNAPSQYPGDAAIEHIYRQAIPAEDQFKMDASRAANQALLGGAPMAGTGSQTPAQAAPAGLTAAESGGNPAAVNAQGYSGSGQFGKARLTDLGFYQPAQGENLNDNTQWPGKVSVPGFAVANRDDLLKNAPAQAVIMGAHMADIDKAIDATQGAAGLSRDGLKAVAHLGGVEGMRKFVSSGGAYDPADANGTRLSDYYRRFAGAPAGAGGPQAATPAPVQVAGPGAPTGTTGLPPAAVDTPSTQAPPGAQPAPQGLRGEPALAVGPDGLTADQRRIAQVMASSPGVTTPALATMLETFRQHNAEVQHRAFTEARQAEKDAAEARTRGLPPGYERGPDGVAHHVAGLPEAAGPFPGNSPEAAANNILLSLRTKMQDGSASDDERAQYALAWQKLAADRIEPVPDPTDPTGQRMMLGRVPGQVPTGFPAPDYKPGAATPAAGTAPAGSGQAANGSGAQPIAGTQKPPPVPTQDQSQAATYATRMAKAHDLMTPLDDTAVSVMENAKKRVGGWFGVNLNSPDAQRLRQAQLDFLNAVLRKESGAAISEGEYNRYAEQYFPMPGDNAATIRQKQANRATTIQGMQREAGPAYRYAGEKPPEPAKAADTPSRVIEYDAMGRRKQ